jgi:8-oxo-dGTP pyrophosphatase MutT (NUDIX family)
MENPEIRNAATVILLRDRATAPRVLMGQRGRSAVFMPNKFVFPGGALDAADRLVPLADPVSELCHNRLCAAADPALATPLVLAAIREVWEETGLSLGTPAPAGYATSGLPSDWQGFFRAGLAPSGRGMQFIFRAITPKGRPRRFDARFFMVDADEIAEDLDDFSNASDELRHLQWVPLADTRQFDLPFITEVVLAEVQARLASPSAHHDVPFFYHEGGRSFFRRL